MALTDKDGAKKLVEELKEAPSREVRAQIADKTVEEVKQVKNKG
jgi:ribosomal protein S17E